jgi:RTA1 like protein
MPDTFYKNCTEVSPECPVFANLYGHSPNLIVNLILAIFFGACALFHIGANLRYRAWIYRALAMGCLIECAGYVGRVIMHYNVWNNAGFQTQLSCLIQGPAYLSAAIYLTLKHIVINID